MINIGIKNEGDKKLACTVGHLPIKNNEPKMTNLLTLELQTTCNMKHLLLFLTFTITTSLAAQSSIGLNAATILSDYRNAGYTPTETQDSGKGYTIEVIIEGATLAHVFDDRKICTSMLVVPAHNEGLEYYKSQYTKIYPKTSDTTWKTPDRNITLLCDKDENCWFEWK